MSRGGLLRLREGLTSGRGTKAFSRRWRNLQINEIPPLPFASRFAELLFQSVGLGSAAREFFIVERRYRFSMRCNNSRGTLKAWCGLRGSRGCLWHLRGKSILVEASYRFQADSLKQKNC